MAKFWPQMAKFWPSQNFPGIYTMIFSKETIRVVSISKKIQDTVWLVPRKESKFKEVPYQKLGRFIAAFGSYRSKTLKTVNFCQKWPNFHLKWPKFHQIRIFQAYRVWFPQRRPQETQKTLTPSYLILWSGIYFFLQFWIKNVKFWPFFD